jgi:SPP1 family predicted phage head-tail adaptor
MRAGKLNSRVTIQQLSAGADALGQPVQTWTDFSTVWGEIKFNSGMQTVRSDADISIIKASVRIRYATGITAGMRATAAGYVFHIKAVLPDISGKQYTDMVCEVVL